MTFCFLISPVLIITPVICEIISALEPGKWGRFQAEKVWMTYASSVLSLSATNGNLATALNFLHQKVIVFLLYNGKRFCVVLLIMDCIPKLRFSVFFDWLISRNEKVSQKDMSGALQKWRADRKYVANYNLKAQRGVKVGKLIK